MNHIILIGNIGGDIVLPDPLKDVEVVSFRLATNRKYTDTTGTEQKVVCWHTVVAFGWLARSLDGLPKGTRLMIAGEMTSRQYTRNDGTTQQTYEVRAFSIGLPFNRDPNK